jgi:dTMP kinase
MPTHDSLFLVLEGLDGAGKSEVSRRLTHLLRQTLGDRIRLTFEPHDPSAAGLFIRQVLTRRVPASARTLALAYALNRADHNERVIAPFLDAGDGRVLICDRYYLSSLVYQNTPEQDMAAIMALNAAARRPDLTLFLDASEETCYARMGGRGSRELFDERLAEMREKYAAGINFLRGRGETVVTVNADSSLLDVLNHIIDILNAHAPWLAMQRLLLLEESVPFSYQPNLNADIVPFSLTTGQAWQAFVASEMHSGEPVAEAYARFSARIGEDIRRMPLSELANLFIARLRGLHYRVGDRLPWPDMLAYRLEYTQPVGVAQFGALILLTEPMRYDRITRKLQENGDGAMREFDFVLVFDPNADTAQDYERESLGTLSAAVRVFGRRDVAALLGFEGEIESKK